MAKVFHCLFEQSGTFKNEFIKLGYKAFDYDILDDFHETDFQKDLFSEIDNAFEGKPSIFDGFGFDDFVLAFFPCVRFSVQSNFMIRAAASQYISLPDVERVSVSMRYEAERSRMYQLFCKLVHVCLSRGIKCVVENPFHAESYLVKYFPIAPAYVDYNRRDRGDAYEKPTMFFFINCKPLDNFIFESVAYHPHLKVEKNSTVKRSMITPDYANRFIREFLLEGFGS